MFKREKNYPASSWFMENIQGAGRDQERVRKMSQQSWGTILRTCVSEKEGKQSHEYEQSIKDIGRRALRRADNE